MSLNYFGIYDPAIVNKIFKQIYLKSIFNGVAICWVM
jgi:hypothetical protein